LLETQRHPYFLTHQIFSPSQIRRLLIPEARQLDAWEPSAFDALEMLTEGTDPVTRASTFELRTFLLSMLLRDTDQMSMAHALEVRVPLLDHRLVEFVFSLPGDIRLDRKWPKPLITKTLGTELPTACVRRPKRGFELPFSRWLRGALHHRMRESFLGDSAVAVPFDRDALAQLWSAFEEGRLHWSRVWSVFALREWLRVHRVQLGA
jgi:asparagine synthase (glutamine-hydrolysing)